MEELTLWRKQCGVDGPVDGDVGHIVGNQTLQEGHSVVARHLQDAAIIKSSSVKISHGAPICPLSDKLGRFVKQIKGIWSRPSLSISPARSYNYAMRILFVSSTRVGDAVLSTGLLDHLIKTHPGALITVACGPAAADLFRAVPGLERIIALEKMVGSLHWLRFWVLAVGTWWDLVVDLRNAPLTYLLPARRQRHFKRSQRTEHRLIEVSRVLGLGAAPPSPRLWLSEVDQARAANFIPDGPPVLAIGPTANWRAKTWRAERFAELALRVIAADGLLPGARVALFGRNDERPQVMRLIEALPRERCLDLIGGPDLLEIYACLQRCDLYVGNDSGLMHLSAAAGVPTLGLFGPSKEELYGPWGPYCAPVRTPQTFDTIHPEGFNHVTSDSLMDDLTVDTVAAALADVWGRQPEIPR